MRLSIGSLMYDCHILEHHEPEHFPLSEPHDRCYLRAGFARVATEPDPTPFDDCEEKAK